ncbi:AT-rich interactive domain-containing protein 4B isoform X1 [Monodelphis domestica]|uniref:AT-rich interactive domain-containing protein 4B isoform X1 n=1 Tax=Monodelphis domestica TaxID=13616 RepID=UPI0024E26C75|nr:AT-rich interactive domain-containing protein 4B isoform X1 [Monodelphis domestica]XP_056672080.1 AT-rich interactive domain-containing protein 4B isoform X1 [Monodelphis domestica]XP_056672081.1 AT-rich interactive domain-containing protein 4B isoform X1 [Monodelphis domestica]
MKAIDEPPYLTVGTDVSAKYRGAFCEAKIKTTKRLVKVKVTFRHDSSTVEVQDDHIKGPLKVGAIVEVKNPDGAYQEAVINKLTDASWYTVVFDDGDEKTLRRSSLCLKGERHFAESETLDQLPLTNPEHFGTPVIGKKTNRGRRSNHIPEEESSSSSSDEDEDDRKQIDELLGKVVCVDYISLDKKKALWFPALVVCPDCSDDIAVKKDNILVRSFKDGKFTSVPRKDVHEISNETSPKPDAVLKQAFDHALEFHKSKTVPSNWKTELKEDSSSSEAEEEEEEEDDEKEKEDNSSEEEAKIEPFPEERENFLQQLYKFMEDRGTPINKRPVLGYRNLNLFKLFRLVHKLGGFDNIESGAIWKQVYQDLGIPVLNSAAGYNVKCAYKKYLYGFEEYCRSANIEFQMALPEKMINKPCKECENAKETKNKDEPESEIKVEVKDEGDTVLQEEKPAEEEIERKENIKPCLGNKKNLSEPTHTQSDQEKELNIKKTEENENIEVKEDETIKVDEMLNTKVEAEEEKAKSGDETNKEEDEDEEEAEEEEEEEEEEEDDDDDNNEQEEFECYPPGMKVQVRYGRGKNQKMYEASIKDSDVEGGEVLYLVHYCGWNVRYDEWIKADKIVRPADKNVPKIKHRKKIKNKIDKEKEKDEKYSPKNCKLRRLSKPPFPVNTPPEIASKLDTETKNSEQVQVKSVEITSILNGLQASESSAEDSEQEDEARTQDIDNNGKEESKADTVSHDKNELSPKEEQSSLSVPQENKIQADSLTPKSISKSPERLRKDFEEISEDTDYEDEVTIKRKDVKKETIDKSKPQVKRGKRRHCNAEECLKPGSPSRKEEKPKSKESLCLENSSNSSSDDDEEKSKAKVTPTKKYNGLDDKRKSLRTTGFYSGFSEVAEKRIKLLNNSDERLQNSRAKDRKDVWSSIQGQWPKKTLKELFSDSDTEAAASPPHASSEDVATEEQLQTVAEEENGSPGIEIEKPLPANLDIKPVEEKTIEVNDKKSEFPSSGSNSVLNTPPTTPESPSSVTVTETSRQQSSANVSETLAPNQEEVRSIKSETDSTIEVDSVAGELQDLQSEGNISPTGFDASVSSSSSNQPELEHPGKVCTGQKRVKDAQGGGSSSKKQKRSHKTSVVNNKKKGKTTNSSDSEELSAGESMTKSQPAKSVSTGMKSHNAKSPARTQSPGKCSGKNGDKDSELKEHHNRLPKVYKWSFQMSDLENMTSTERIAILQEKLQEIRKHYLSLKSEVASIDRRRKRLKKKERESAATSSSSSSSPSSSSITAAVMLTLAEPSMSSASQPGMSVECR